MTPKKNNEEELPKEPADVIEDRVLEEEMKQAYLDYAMSVIVSRALPDVRDGMKPVHRRILYGMSEMGLRSGAKYRKCAAVVGDVLGKYHPHGDSPVYQALVRLAQDFSMRYQLVDGQGNFGSIDGDNPAAMRYTEAKMTAIADEMLADLDKETVPMVENYDGTKKEPTVLPAKVPQLLMNGSTGIAVGMATSIPPHNLSELMDGVVALIDKPEITVEELMEHIKGPDFPTGGIIFNPADIKQCYITGKGRVVTRAVAEIEEDARGFKIVVTELPYMVNKADLLEKIANLVKDKKIKGISDLRDESDRDGIRVVVDLKKESYPKKVLNQLFKMTSMQTSFTVNLLALVDGLQPRVLDLKSALEYFLAHRQEVVTARVRYDLRRAEEREHILAGLKLALDKLDAVITTIRKSATREEAQAALIKQFKLTAIQAQAILEMRLQALAGLERKKVEDEHAEKVKLIAELKKILDDPKKVLKIVREESVDIKDKYGDARKTKISRSSIGKFSEEDLIPNESVVIAMSAGGYIKRQEINAYKTQKRGGKGVIGMVAKEEDAIQRIQVAKNHDDILFFTTRGRVFRQKVYEIPQASRIAKGTPVVNMIQMAPEEKVSGWLIMRSYEPANSFVFVTKKGVIKRTAVAMYQHIRTNGLIAIKLDEGDELRFIGEGAPGDDVMIVTQDGQSIRFKQDDIRPQGRSTRGVLGMRLRANDAVVGAAIANKDMNWQLLVVSQKGLGKRTDIDKYPIQRRGGIGVKTMSITDKTGKLVAARLIVDGFEGEIIMTSKSGQVIRMPLKGIPNISRTTQGVKLMRLGATDTVASFTVFAEDEDKEIDQQAESQGLEITASGEVVEEAKPEKETPKKDKSASAKSDKKVEKAPAKKAAKTEAKKSTPKAAAGFTRRTIAPAKGKPAAKPKVTKKDTKTNKKKK